MKVTISNYRGIRADRPISLELRSDIQFIVGRNNTGKSSLLRFFSELKPVLSIGFDPQVNPTTLQANIQPYFWDAIANRDSIDAPMTVLIETDLAKWKLKITPHGSHHTQIVNVEFRASEYMSPEAVKRAALIFSKTLYFGSVRNTAYSGNNPVHNVVSGTNLISTWATWSTGEDIKHQLATKKLEHEIRDLFGFREFSMKVNDGRNALKVTYDDGTFSLTELGDGLSHFITVLANALISEPSFILIDEPENGLHPQLQTTFVQTLAKKCSRGLLATSHSLALARTVADKVLLCSKNVTTGTQLFSDGAISHSTLTQELTELSYAQALDIQEQNLLLVEGRTDVKTFREILGHFGIEKRFIVLPLAGGSFLNGDVNSYEVELAELKKVGAKSINVIIDSEKESESSPLEASRAAFVSLSQRLGFNIHVTARRSIENYFSEAALRQALRDQSKTALTEFETFSQGKGWAKARNWQIAAAMTRKDLENTDLGQFVLTVLAPKAAF